MASDSGENTVRCSFNNKFKAPAALQIHKWIFEEIKLEKRDVKGIRFDYEQTCLFLKLANDILCEKLVRENSGILKFRHVDGKVSDVVVTLVSYGIRKVKVCDLPPEIPDKEISKCLSVYGSVMTVTRDKWPKTFPLPVENGVRTVKINLWKHIPSFTYVCCFRAFISYTGQPQTCSICNAVGHFRKQCPLKRRCCVTCGCSLDTQEPAEAEHLQENGCARESKNCQPDPCGKAANVTTSRGAPVPAQTIGGRRRRRQLLRKRAE